MSEPSENIPIRRPSCGIRSNAMKFAPRLVCVAVSLVMVCSLCSAGTLPRSSSVRSGALTAQSLEKLSRSLKDNEKIASAAYARLALLAKGSSGVFAMRAALALGYFDYGKGDYAQAQEWFARAKADPLLADYALYWIAETHIAQGRNADALAELQKFHTEFPASAMTEQALQSLGNAAIAANQPQAAVAALDAYDLTRQRPALLFCAAKPTSRRASRSMPRPITRLCTCASRPASTPARPGRSSIFSAALSALRSRFRRKNSLNMPRSSSTQRLDGRAR